MTNEHRDALARIIAPDSWGLRDDPRMKTESIKDAVVEDSRKIAQNIIDSGLMASLDWDNKEFLAAKKAVIRATSTTGRCMGMEDGMDGYCAHDVRCRYWPDTATGPNSNCIR